MYSFCQPNNGPWISIFQWIATLNGVFPHCGKMDGWKIFGLLGHQEFLLLTHLTSCCSVVKSCSFLLLLNDILCIYCPNRTYDNPILAPNRRLTKGKALSSALLNTLRSTVHNVEQSTMQFRYFFFLTKLPLQFTILPSACYAGIFCICFYKNSISD